MLPEGGDRLLVIANEVSGDVPSVVGREESESGHLHRNHLPINLHLRRTARGKNQVADFLSSAQHRAEQRWSGDSTTSRKTL